MSCKDPFGSSVDHDFVNIRDQYNKIYGDYCLKLKFVKKMSLWAL